MFLLNIGTRIRNENSSFRLHIQKVAKTDVVERKRVCCALLKKCADFCFLDEHLGWNLRERIQTGYFFMDQSYRIEIGS